MAHSLILGVTECGKTTLGKKLSQHFIDSGYGVIVLDPLNDPAWPASFKTSDPDEFLRVFKKSRKCFVFIDEAGQAVGRFNNEMEQTATMGRHFGHSCFFLSQRAKQINTTVRDQCSYLALFTSSLDDSKIHANEWNHPELCEAYKLPKGKYFYCDRFNPVETRRVF